MNNNLAPYRRNGGCEIEPWQYYIKVPKCNSLDQLFVFSHNYGRIIIFVVEQTEKKNVAISLLEKEIQNYNVD